MMLTKTALHRKCMNLGLLFLGICLFSLPAQGAELAKPVATTSSWLSQLTSWGVQAFKNTVTAMTVIATPFAVSKSANALSDAVVPTNRFDKKHTYSNGCARLAAHTLVLGGVCTAFKKAIPYLTGDTEKPFMYYATLFPMLYLGARAAHAAKNYWGRTSTNFLTQVEEFSFRGIYDRLTECSWSETGKLAGSTALLLGSYWLGSHVPLLVQSFFFDTPVPYLSLAHMLSFVGMNEVYSRFFSKTGNTLFSCSENPMIAQNPFLGAALKRLRPNVPKVA